MTRGIGDVEKDISDVTGWLKETKVRSDDLRSQLQKLLDEHAKMSSSLLDEAHALLGEASGDKRGTVVAKKRGPRTPWQKLIIEALAPKPLSQDALGKKLPEGLSPSRLEKLLEKLRDDGKVVQDGDRWSLA